MKRIFFSLLFVLLLPVWAEASTYYVDCNADGDDGAGTSTAANVAWKTIAKVNGSSFSAGDSILFNKGCTWREQLTAPSSGGAGSPITFGAYGSGVNPIISGADITTGWTNYAPPAEVVPNGTMEADSNWNYDTAGTTNERSTTQVHAGTYSRKFIGYAWCGLKSDTFTLIEGAHYDVSIWYYTANGGDGFLTVRTTDTTEIFQDYFTATQGSGQHRTGHFDVPVGQGGPGTVISLKSVTTDTTWYFDDFSVNGPVATSIYYKDMGAASGVVIQDGTPLAFKTWNTDIATTNLSAGQYTMDTATNRVYVWCTDSAAPSTHTMEIATRDYGVNITSKDYVTISGFDIYGAKSYGGIWVTTSTFITLSGNTVRYNTIAGIRTQDTLSDSNFTGNTIYGNKTHGIDCVWSVATAGRENIIQNNIVHNNLSHGISLIASYYIVQYNTVYDNGFIGTATVGISVFDNTASYGANNIIRYNRVYGQISGGDDGEGIYADEGSSATQIYYNVVYGNDGPGIAAHHAQGASIYNNTVYGNCLNSSGELTTKAEIKILGAAGADVTDILIKNNVAQATQANTYAIYLDSNAYDSTGLSITNNDWFTSAANWYFWNATGGATLATWNALTGVGTDINSDPLFVNAAGGDFRLQTGSPAINAGVDVGLTTDYAGNTLLGYPDMGAYEYFGLSLELLMLILEE